MTTILSRSFYPIILFSFALFTGGCSLFTSSTNERPRLYTVADLPSKPILAPRPFARMADDLRAARTPLRFNNDGTVEPCRGIHYYAPLELAITRALQDATLTPPNMLGQKQTVVIETFGIDARGDAPLARITLRSAQENVITRTAPAPKTPETLRKCLGDLLLEAYREACSHQSPSY